MEQSFETMWRMAKVAGGIDTTVRFIETLIETAPTLKFRNTTGKEIPIRDLAGLARSVQAATSVPQGAAFDERDVKFIEPNANFLMIDVGRNAREFITTMPTLGVAPGRPFPPLDNMLRVSIGTDADMAKFREVFWKVY